MTRKFKGGGTMSVSRRIASSARLSRPFSNSSEIVLDMKSGSSGVLRCHSAVRIARIFATLLSRPKGMIDPSLASTRLLWKRRAACREIRDQIFSRASARTRTERPSLVRMIPFALRENKRTPRSRSMAFSWRVSCGCPMPISRAALRMLPVLATAMKRRMAGSDVDRRAARSSTRPEGRPSPAARTTRLAAFASSLVRRTPSRVDRVPARVVVAKGIAISACRRLIAPITVEGGRSSRRAA